MRQRNNRLFRKFILLIVKEVLQMAVMGDRGSMTYRGDDLMERPLRTVAYVLSVAVDMFCCLSSCSVSRNAERILMKFGIVGFY